MVVLYGCITWLRGTVLLYGCNVWLRGTVVFYGCIVWLRGMVSSQEQLKQGSLRALLPGHCSYDASIHRFNEQLGEPIVLNVGVISVLGREREFQGGFRYFARCSHLSTVGREFQV